MNIYNPGNKNTVYSPIWLHINDNLELPRDRESINAWCRSFYALDPDVSRIINQHATLPLKYFKIINTNNNVVDSFFNQLNIKLGLPSILELIITEYLVLGEVFIYTPFDETNASWSHFLIQNPDYIIVKRNVVSEDNSEIFLRPDENLRRIVQSNKPEDIEQSNKINSKILDTIRSNQNIQLDNFYISHLVRKISPYEIRGSSVLNPLLRILNNPNKTPKDIETIKSTLLDIQTVNNSITKDLLYQKYVQLFEMIENWINKKIYAPMATINKFYDIKDNKKILLFPRVEFDSKQLLKDLKG